MSKSSITIGILLSVALHALIFWPPSRQADIASNAPEPEPPPAQPESNQRVTVRVVPVPVPPPIEPQPEPEPVLELPSPPTTATPRQALMDTPAATPDEPQEVVVAPAPVPPPEPRVEQPDERPEPEPLAGSRPAFQEVVPAPAPVTERAARTSSEASEDSDDALPTLRIEWRSARQLTEVSRALAMRVIAVDAAGDIVGEITMMGAPALVPFEGRLSSYSNRVRTLARDYFGPPSRWPGGEDIAALWILVPAGVDRLLAQVQRDAIRDAGLQVAEVKVTEGRFEAYGSSYRLVITRIM